MRTDKARAKQPEAMQNEAAGRKTTRRPRRIDIAFLFCFRCGEAMNAETGPEICPRCGFRQCVGCSDS